MAALFAWKYCAEGLHFSALILPVVQAGSPQLAPASHKESVPATEREEEEEDEESSRKTVHVAGADVPLREKILKKSVSNRHFHKNDTSYADGM